MKNQYFGDINDYRKYGLIRSILDTYNFRLLMAWMLTPDDSRTDGKFIDYLSEPYWDCYDSVLYKKLQNLICLNNIRKVAFIEKTNLLPGAKYFSRIVLDSRKDRTVWFQELLFKANDADLVFLDPDNGIEVKSKPYGKKDSSKYLYWREISDLWKQGKSLLIYQHFCREKRKAFIERLRDELQKSAEDSSVSAFATPRVVFFLVLQPGHQKYLNSIVSNIENNWGAEKRRVAQIQMCKFAKGMYQTA